MALGGLLDFEFERGTAVDGHLARKGHLLLHRHRVRGRVILYELLVACSGSILASDKRLL